MRWLPGMTYVLASDTADTPKVHVFVDGLPPHDAELCDSPSSRGCLLELLRERLPDAYVASQRTLSGSPWFVLVTGDDIHFGRLEGGSEFELLLFALGADRENEVPTSALQLRILADAKARVASTLLEISARRAPERAEYETARAKVLLAEAASLYERYRATAISVGGQST